MACNSSGVSKRSALVTVRLEAEALPLLEKLEAEFVESEFLVPGAALKARVQETLSSRTPGTPEGSPTTPTAATVAPSATTVAPAAGGTVVAPTPTKPTDGKPPS